MNLAHRFPLGLLALLLAGCESPLSPDEMLALRAAERRWAARGFQDYRFEIRHSCFCELELLRWSRVDVVGGKIVRIHNVETGDTVPARMFSRYNTIETLFRFLRTTQFTGEWTDDVVLEFDPQLGYPTRVRLVSAPGIEDAGSVLDLRAAGPIPAP